MKKQIRSNLDLENKLNGDVRMIDNEKVDSRVSFCADEFKAGLADTLAGLEKMTENTMNKSSVIWLIKPVLDFLIRKEIQLERLNEELMRLKEEGTEREINNFIEYRLGSVDELKLYAAWVDGFADLYDSLVLQSGLIESHPEYNLKTAEEIRHDLRNVSTKEKTEKRNKLLDTAAAMLK